LDVILSLKPRYLEAIFSGTKKFEFRRRIFKRNDIEKVFIYSSNGVRAIVGYFKIEEILMGTPEYIWSICGAHGGISREEYFEYFRGSDTAYAIKIGELYRFSKPLNPHELIDGFIAPRSFRYIDYLSL
jgi:predicted transcriptional regulator